MHPDIFHKDFTPTPYWWEAYTPSAGELIDVPREARVAIVGGGYAGLSAALELAKHGIEAVVFEANAPGFGASTEMAVPSAAASMSARVLRARPSRSMATGSNGYCPTPAMPTR
jgi:NADPH-dependent 2,4-dienoyl-CoA reductase/sulfur reductase-like enzyme